MCYAVWVAKCTFLYNKHSCTDIYEINGCRAKRVLIGTNMTSAAGAMFKAQTVSSSFGAVTRY